MAREVKALSFIDCVHFAPHQLVDVKELGCDFLACSAYKFHGPHIGVMYGRRERLESLDVPKLEPAPETNPERLETGTQNHEGIVGRRGRGQLSGFPRTRDGWRRRRTGDSARAAAGRVRIVSRAGGTTRRTALGRAERAGRREAFRPSTDAPRTPTLAFTVKGKPRCGGHAGGSPTEASSPLMVISTRPRSRERLGVTESGFVRIGCACYTTSEEAGRVIEAVRAIAAR